MLIDPAGFSDRPPGVEFTVIFASETRPDGEFRRRIMPP
jgi:hypothetical protein